MIYEIDPDIICFTEHWIKSSEIEHFVIKGYYIVDIYTRVQGYGGVCLFAKNHLINSLTVENRAQDLCYEKVFECCVINLNLRIREYKSRSITIIGVYRSPSVITLHKNNVCIIDEKGNCCFFNRLQKLLKLTNALKNDVILVGDLNLDALKQNDTSVKELFYIFRSYNLKSKIKEVTRFNEAHNTGSSIDYVVTNINDDDIEIKIVNTLISDHLAQQIIINNMVLPSNYYYQEKRIFSEANKEIFLSYLSSFDWCSIIMSLENSENMFNIFYNNFNWGYNTYFPNVTKKVWLDSRGHINKWLTVDIKKLKNKVRKAYKCKNKANMKPLRAKYKKKYKSSRRNHIEKHIVNAKNTAKATWEVVKTESGRSKKSNVFKKLKLRNNNELVDAPTVVAETLNKYFVNSVESIIQEAKENNNSNFKIYGPRTDNSAIFFPCDFEEVKKVINNLPNKSAPGEDGVTAETIKCTNDVTSLVLSHIINCLLHEGIFPSILKTGKISPIPKVKNACKVEQFRPIALLSIFSKIIEKLVHKRIVNFCNKYNIFSKSQHGFRAGRSTQTAILEIIDEINFHHEKNNYLLAIFIDLKKAFDVVMIELLIKKLEHYGFRGKCLEFLKSYLTGRSQYVNISQINDYNNVKENHRSETSQCNFGVPQGSVLGPLLFILFINDIEHALKSYCKIILYADDIVLLVNGANLNDLVKKQRIVMEKLKEYLNTNCLIMNEIKTSYMLFNRSADTKEMFETKSNCKLSTSCKYLGVYIDDKLTWAKHVEYVSKKLGSINYAMRLIRQIGNLETLKTVYFGYVQSILSYAILAWGASENGQSILKYQKKIIRTMVGAKPRQSCKELFKQLSIMTFPSMCMFALLVYTKNNISKYKTNVEVSGYRTRQANKLHKETCKTKKQQKCYNSLGPKLFNLLPLAYQNIQDINKFKEMVQKHLLSENYYKIIT